MHPIHGQEKKQFKKLFKQDHIDRLEDRFRVLEAFLTTEQHVSEEELLAMVNQNGRPKLDSEFVRDTLALMCRYGFARKRHFENNGVRYEHRHLGQHHDHLICTKCGKISEFENEQLEALQSQVAVANGFHMLQHKLEIYGICEDCLQKRAGLMPLVMAKPGEKVVVREFSGGPGSHMRLTSMGLRKGDLAEIITNLGKGQVVVAIDCKRYAFGHGLAQKVMVEPLAKR